MMELKEIKITDFDNLKIGQVEDKSAGTGLTVVIAPNGVPTGLDIRGGGPASRESGLMDPLAAAEVVHAVVIAGGSAFGLDAAGGVMQFLSENGIGFPVGEVVVPLVCQSDIFDLGYGRNDVFPDKEMGYKAASAAFENEKGIFKSGNYGAGCGATVGKLLGMDRCSKSGIGSYAVSLGNLKVGAIVCTNAVGDVYDYKTGARISGVMSEDGSSLNPISSEELLYQSYLADSSGNSASILPSNTTIGIVFTNARFNKSQLCKLAGMTHDAYGRCIRPIHTSMDGDSIYAMSLGDVKASLDLVGTLANQVMCEAIKRSVTNTE